MHCSTHLKVMTVRVLVVYRREWDKRKHGRCLFFPKLSFLREHFTSAVQLNSISFFRAAWIWFPFHNLSPEAVLKNCFLTKGKWLAYIKDINIYTKTVWHIITEGDILFVLVINLLQKPQHKQNHKYCILNLVVSFHSFLKNKLCPSTPLFYIIRLHYLKSLLYIWINWTILQN